MFYTKVNRERGMTGCDSTNTGHPLSVNSWVRYIYTPETYNSMDLFHTCDRPVWLIAQIPSDLQLALIL